MACAIAFVIPLKLSYIYIGLIPTLVIWLFACPDRVKSALYRSRTVVLPLVIFLSVALYSSLFGIDPLNSLSKGSRMLLYAFSIPFFLDAASKKPILPLLCLLLSSSLTALYAVLQSSFPEEAGRIFHGQVSHSGQLALTILVLVGFMAVVAKLAKEEPHPSKWLGSICIGVGLLLVGFGESFSVSQSARHLIAIALTILLVWQTVKLFRSANPTAALQNWLILVCLPLLLSALLVNLKRGPWLGVLLGLSLYFLIKKPVRIIPVLLIAAGVSFFIEPINERIMDSPEHFTISGGRSTIWQIGSDLAIRYPLGVGFANSRFLRDFSVEIPPELQHFHNNMLNILVETGWLGLFLYLWWVFAIVVWHFRARKSPLFGPLLLSGSCAFLSWQIAGIVEYNFGDSEVYLLAVAVAGMMLAFQENEALDS